MIGYITLGTNDLERAASFYDRLLTMFEAKRVSETRRMILWSNGKPGRAGLSVIKPYDGNAASAGNGSMVALGVNAPEKVDALHKLALELGAKDEGAPGPRGDGFYGAYFRDLDDNKLCVFCMVRK
jgi:predicted lactoylglutathione lyase